MYARVSSRVFLFCFFLFWCCCCCCFLNEFPDDRKLFMSFSSSEFWIFLLMIFVAFKCSFLFSAGEGLSMRRNSFLAMSFMETPMESDTDWVRICQIFAVVASIVVEEDTAWEEGTPVSCKALFSSDSDKYKDDCWSSEIWHADQFFSWFELGLFLVFVQKKKFLTEKLLRNSCFHYFDDLKYSWIFFTEYWNIFISSFWLLWTKLL